MKRICFLAIIFMLILDQYSAIASNIRLKVSSSSTYQNGTVCFDVSIRNDGDEPAYSLSVEAQLETNTFFRLVNSPLGTNETCTVSLGPGNAPQVAGIYTVPVKVRYADAGGYPSTVVSSIPVITAEPDDINEAVMVKLPGAEIEESGLMHLYISTLGTNNVKASITMIHPEAISCTPGGSETTMTPGSTNTIDIAITNLSALSGSSLPVTAVVDYMENKVHRSTSISTSIRIARQGSSVFENRKICGIVALSLVAIFCFLQLYWRRSAITEARGLKGFFPESRLDSICVIIVLAAILGFLICHIPLKYLLLNTTTTGGDTPAHNYLASHLKDQLFHHGRIVSWSNGWWCGFPMFQYYFCLPYILVALLSVLVPFNIAFKIVSVLGIFSLPVCAYVSGRMMRMPNPVPIIMSIFTIPFLFIGPQTMWGGNIYSTLAGMISNSISFPLMLLFIASSWRDADDGIFRIRTTLLLTLLLASHFFTSIIGGLCVAIIPFLNPRAGLRKALRVLAIEYTLAFLLMAWWLIPLIAKQEYTVDFGTNWNIDLVNTLPHSWLWPLLLFSVISVIVAIIRRVRAVAIFCWMLTCSIILFYFGHVHVAEVFVNVRLWPFAFFAILAICAAGAGLIIAEARYKFLAVMALLVATLSFGIYTPNNVRNWAEWNYRGFERNARWGTFQKLGNAVSHTPGRLAYDLHPDNQSFGSSRAFECFPHLFGKPILEGGIVNSAAGSIFSYYIQSETSRDCAGYPQIVRPAGFNFTNATRHLELFNVKHFIARWTGTQEALSHSRDWRLLCESDGWQLYELTTHSGNYVYVPDNQPVGVQIQSRKTDNWKKAGLEWIYTIQLLETPFAFLRKGEPDNGRFATMLRENEFIQYCQDTRNSSSIRIPSLPVQRGNIMITDEKVTSDMISFRTSATGLPHIIKCTYSPNWKVTGAQKIFMVTPCFMLVYPDKEEVQLNYGYTLSDNVGRAVSIIGLILLITAGFWLRRTTLPMEAGKHHR